MSERKKGLSRPDAAGVWMNSVTTRKFEGYVYTIEMKDGEPCYAASGGVVGEDEDCGWYRCYIPELGSITEDVKAASYSPDYKRVAEALKRAGVYVSSRHTSVDIDVLAAERDRLRAELTSLRAKGETDKHESFVDHLATFLRKSPQNCTSVMKMADAFRDVHEVEGRDAT